MPPLCVAEVWLHVQPADSDDQALAKAWAAPTRFLTDVASQSSWTSGAFRVAGCLVRLLEAEAFWMCESCGYQHGAVGSMARPHACPDTAPSRFHMEVKGLFDDGTAHAYIGGWQV